MAVFISIALMLVETSKCLKHIIQIENLTGLTIQLARGKPAAYLQAWPRLWTRDYREQTQLTDWAGPPNCKSGALTTAAGGHAVSTITYCFRVNLTCIKITLRYGWIMMMKSSRTLQSLLTFRHYNLKLLLSRGYFERIEGSPFPRLYLYCLRVPLLALMFLVALLTHPSSLSFTGFL